MAPLEVILDQYGTPVVNSGHVRQPWVAIKSMGILNLHSRSDLITLHSNFQTQISKSNPFLATIILEMEEMDISSNMILPCNSFKYPLDCVFQQRRECQQRGVSSSKPLRRHSPNNITNFLFNPACLKENYWISFITLSRESIHSSCQCGIKENTFI